MKLSHASVFKRWREAGGLQDINGIEQLPFFGGVSELPESCLIESLIRLIRQTDEVSLVETDFNSGLEFRKPGCPMVRLEF
jgi:hypothetical protein